MCFCSLSDHAMLVKWTEYAYALILAVAAADSTVSASEYFELQTYSYVNLWEGG